MPAGCVVYDNGSQRRELEEDTPFTVTEVKDKPCVFDTNREVVAGGVTFSVPDDYDLQLAPGEQQMNTLHLRDALRDIAKAIEAGAGARSGLVYPHTSDAIKSLDKIQ